MQCGKTAERHPRQVGIIIITTPARRPDQNAARMEAGALRLSMPPVPKDLYINAVKSVVAANADFVGRAALSPAFSACSFLG